MTTINIPAGATSLTINFNSPSPIPTPIPVTTAGYALPLPPRDANGFTLYPAIQSGQAFYVSSSTGSDTNKGTQAAPFKTLAVGLAAMTSGHGDHLLLKAGDVFSGYIPSMPSGASRIDPAVIGCYGTGANPVIKSIVNADGSISNAVSHFSSSTPMAHVLVADIVFYCSVRDPASPDYVEAAGTQDPLPLELLGYTAAPVTDFEFCNCSFSFFGGGLVAEPGDSSTNTLNDIRINRCHESSYYLKGSRSGGDYFQNVANLLLDTNTMVNVGNAWTGQPRDNQSQGIYIRYGTNTSVVGYFIAFADAAAIKLSSDLADGMINTLCQGNVFVGCAIGWDTSGNDRTTALSQKTVAILGNVMSECGATVGGAPECTGIDLVSIDGLTMTGNYFVNNTAITDPSESFMVIFEALPQANQTITGNTSRGVMTSFTGTPAIETDVVTSPNSVTSGSWSVTLGSYAGSVGLTATTAALIAAAQGNTRASWNGQATALAAVAGIAAGH